MPARDPSATPNLLSSSYHTPHPHDREHHLPSFSHHEQNAVRIARLSISPSLGVSPEVGENGQSSFSDMGPSTRDRRPSSVSGSGSMPKMTSSSLNFKSNLIPTLGLSAWNGGGEGQNQGTAEGSRGGGFWSSPFGRRGPVETDDEEEEEGGNDRAKGRDRQGEGAENKGRKTAERVTEGKGKWRQRHSAAPSLSMSRTSSSGNHHGHVLEHLPTPFGESNNDDSESGEEIQNPDRSHKSTVGEHSSGLNLDLNPSTSSRPSKAASKPKNIRASLGRSGSSKLAGMRDNSGTSSNTDTSDVTGPPSVPSSSYRASPSGFSRISSDNIHHSHSHSNSNNNGNSNVNGHGNSHIGRHSSLGPTSYTGSPGPSVSGKQVSIASGSPNTMPDQIRESTNRLASMGTFSSNELVEELRRRQGASSSGSGSGGGGCGAQDEVTTSKQDQRNAHLIHTSLGPGFGQSSLAGRMNGLDVRSDGEVPLPGDGRGGSRGEAAPSALSRMLSQREIEQATPQTTTSSTGASSTFPMDAEQTTVDDDSKQIATSPIPTTEATVLTDDERTPKPPLISLANSLSTSSGTIHGSSSKKSKHVIDLDQQSPSSTPSSTAESSPAKGYKSFGNSRSASNMNVILETPPSTESAVMDENTPLLARIGGENPSYGDNLDVEGKPLQHGIYTGYQRSATGGVWDRTLQTVEQQWSTLRKASAADVLRATVLAPVQNLPAVTLGLLLNVLDGVSYGMILFPASPVFPDFGSIGVSMFFMSCVVSQLTYTLGGSIFKGGNGSMMIEAVPFFHILVNIIQNEVGDDPAAIVSTTIFSFAFSSILTGLVFLALGAFKLGSLIGYFPRHILVGCIGGVGVFLIETALEVSLGLKEEGFEYNLTTLKLFFADGHAIALWTIPVVLAITLRMITHRFTHQLIFPTYFFLIPCVFYIVIAIGGWPIAHLRETGWVFDVGQQSQPWYTFYTLFDLGKFSWPAFWACVPTQLALVFFGILHVPLNVPALGVSLQEDNVQLDRELIAHGVSNLAAGAVGTVPNYLCYVNTVLFYRVGGGSRLSGIMLAMATAVIMFVGPSIIGYLPVCVVGALIFVLGFDLVKEAVWDTRYRVNKMEYFTIWVITIGMTLFDFVLGLLIGIVLASLFFVIQNSRRRPIRAIFNGSSATSTVRRPQSQRTFIQAVGRQTLVIKLQGFMFFGTITKVEDEIRNLLEVAAWEQNPIRFLIIDFALVVGLDFSSAEAFVRVQRLMSKKDVLLIFCGAKPDGRVGTALRAVDLWADEEGECVEVFDTLNSALEWTENAYLTAFYVSNAERAQQQQQQQQQQAQIDFPKVKRTPFNMSQALHNSPRRTFLTKAGDSSLDLTSLSRVPSEQNITSKISLEQPFPTLLQTFAPYSEEDPAFFAEVAPYFEFHPVETGDVIWRQDDLPDGLFLIESGSLRATYHYEDHTEFVHETMVAGTVAGELTMLSGSKRNATVVAEQDSKLWKLTTERLEKLEQDKPTVERRFVKMMLKVAAEEVDVISSHLIAALS